MVRVHPNVLKVVVLAARADALLRVRRARQLCQLGEPGCACPIKMGLNWFMPAFAKSSVGSSYGTTGDEGTILCSFVPKYSTN